MHVDNSEKVKAMEDAVLAEKEAIRKQFDKEKKKIMQQTEASQEDKKRLLDELSVREDAQ